MFNINIHSPQTHKAHEMEIVEGGRKKQTGGVKPSTPKHIKNLNFDEIFDCGELKKFASIVKEVLLFRGYSESKFFICEFGSSKTELLVKMAFYKKTIPELYMNNVDNSRMSPHDAEIEVLKLFKKVIIKGNISPCIINIIYYKKCDSALLASPKIKTCHEYVTGDKQENTTQDSINIIFCNYAELIRNDLAFDKFNFLVLEQCDVTFHEYLLRLQPKSTVGFEQFRSYMFQIIYTIYKIRLLFPSFRHGDLHSENIMLKYDKDYVYNPLKPKFYKFYVNGTPRWVPYFGIVCKIIDFGFSVVEEEGIKSSIVDDKFIMFRRTNNDLLFLLTDVWNIQGNNESIVNFLHKLEPNKTYYHFNTDYISHIENNIPTYEEMVNNELFDVYKKINPGDDQIIHEFAK